MRTAPARLVDGVEAAAEDRSVRRGRSLEIAACVVVGALALALVWHDLAQPKGLYGVNQYDDGVYYGSAVRLVAGHPPYRDFDFLQPPGITLITAPIAWATHADTRLGLALARILTALVTGANAFLGAWLVRYRGWLTALLAGGLLAIFPTAFFADHTLLLEPYLILGCLLGACAVFRRGEPTGPWRIALGGLAFGVGGAVKLWAVVPVVVLACCLLPRWRRGVGPFAAGVAAGFLACCLPFFALAPGRFITDVFASQLGRHAAPTRFSVRMWNLTGFRGIAHAVVPPPGAHWPGVVGLLIVGLVAVGLVWPVLRGRCRRAEVYVCATAIAVVPALFVPNEFYSHYVYVTAAFASLALGCAVGRLLEPLARALRARDRGRLGPRLLAAGLGAAALVGVVELVGREVAFDTTALKAAADPGASIARVIPNGACVLTDSASLTVAASRFAGPPGCPPVVDSTGTWIALDPAHPPSPANHDHPPRALVADWRRWLGESDAVVFSKVHVFRVPWTAGLSAYLDANFVRVPAAGAVIYERRPRAAPRTPAPPTAPVTPGSAG